MSSSLVKAVVSPGTAAETVWAYLYDASGQRVAKIEATDANQDDTLEYKAATVYFGDTEVTDADTTAYHQPDLSADRFFTFAGATVAVVHAEQVASTTLDTQLLYVFGDYQGSAQVMMSDARDVNGDPDPANAVITRNAYTPYGAKRSYDANADSTPDASLDLERGWLSQVTDEDPTDGGTGLTYLNARYYDPAASRFISPDPLLNVMDPKTLDPYRYAENNPVSYADANGLMAACSGLTTENEKKCLDSYYDGTGYEPPAKGKTTKKYAKPPAKKPSGNGAPPASPNAPQPPSDPYGGEGIDLGNGQWLHPGVQDEGFNADGQVYNMILLTLPRDRELQSFKDYINIVNAQFEIDGSPVSLRQFNSAMGKYIDENPEVLKGVPLREQIAYAHYSRDSVTAPFDYYDGMARAYQEWMGARGSANRATRITGVREFIAFLIYEGSTRICDVVNGQSQCDL